MIERLGLALVLIALGWLVYAGATRYVLDRRARKGLGLKAYVHGRPAILYFTAPGCAPCITVQRPALMELYTAFDGRLQVIEVDCTENPELADAWGVLSVPTTFVIDSQGRPRGVNHGVARAMRLRDQLALIGEVVPPTINHPERAAGD